MASGGMYRPMLKPCMLGDFLGGGGVFPACGVAGGVLVVVLWEVGASEDE